MKTILRTQLLSLGAAAVFLAIDLNAQIASPTSSLQSTTTTNLSRFAPGDTNAIAERIAALQSRMASAPQSAVANVVSTNAAKIGDDPYGVWKLYIVDDTTDQRSGSISGSWCLILN